MRDERKWRLALAEFEATRVHVPALVSEKFVSDYHAVLDKMADASEEDLDSFRIPPAELKPRVVSAQIGGRHSPGRTHYSKDKYCDTNLFRRKIDALATFLPNIEERMRRPMVSDDSKDYWSMSTPQLERLATKFSIEGYGDQHGQVDRDIIIRGLLRRDSALQSQSSPADQHSDHPKANAQRKSSHTTSNMTPEAAVAILRQLRTDAALLKSEPFGSPRRDEWAETAQGVLRHAFGDGSSILESFGRAQSIVFKAGDTQENLRRAANDQLASEDAVLLSAITQLGWQIASATQATDASQAKKPDLEPQTHNEGPEPNEQESSAIRLVFDFPPPIRSACEQYLMYFVQFLSDLGIDARAEVKERAHSVLFSVTPENDKQALEKIREALQVYLSLPTAPNTVLANGPSSDIAVSQLQANVLHLQSQVLLTKAAIQMTSAALDLKDEQIALLEERLDLRGFQPQGHTSEAASDKEDLVTGLVSVKKWDYKFFELNVPELLRKLKRRFN